MELLTTTGDTHAQSMQKRWEGHREGEQEVERFWQAALASGLVAKSSQRDWLVWYRDSLAAGKVLPFPGESA